MSYHIQIDRQALKTLAGLPEKPKRQVVKKIESLAKNPFPPGNTKLEDDLYRIRSGDYRIIYTVNERQITVCVLRIGDRKEIYRHIPKL